MAITGKNNLAEAKNALKLERLIAIEKKLEEVSGLTTPDGFPIPSPGYIEALIEKLREFQEVITEFKRYPFLNRIQEGAIRSQDLEYYVHCLLPKEREELCDDPLKGRIEEALCYPWLINGRYADVDGCLEWYSEEKHKEYCDKRGLDEQKLKTALQKKKREHQEEFWNLPLFGVVLPPQWLIEEIDKLLTPYLPFIRKYIKLDVRQVIIQQTIDTADPKKISEVERVFFRIREAARVQTETHKQISQKPEKPITDSTVDTPSTKEPTETEQEIEVGGTLATDNDAESQQKSLNLMALTIIPSHFKVTARTLYRCIEKKKLKPHRDESGTVFLNLVEVAKRYERKK